MEAELRQILVERLRELPYVKAARVKPAEIPELDGVLELTTPQGAFLMPIEVKRSYLSRIAVNELVTRADSGPVMLVAHHVARPSGERLARAGINFVDESGNLNLHLGTHYQTLLLGKPEVRPALEKKRLSPGMLQTEFVLLADPSAIDRPARGLAKLAGIGKTVAAEIRQRLIADGTLQPKGRTGGHVTNPKLLAEQFTDGYSRILRPHLFLGSFRSQELDPDRWVNHLAREAKAKDFRYALTGAAGAFELDRYYRSDKTSAFVSAPVKTLTGPLALLPDRHGPITLFRLFSPLVVREDGTRHPVAHLWLIYAELLHTDEPRALEAAREIEKRFLHATPDA